MPERFDHYMGRANAAYYATQNPYQDFTTAPELTQVFGELIGAWAKIASQSLPATPILVEAGPGRGTLMADALRVYGPADLHLIETSPKLRAEQAKRLPNATWHDSLDTLPHRPMILIANEFLDALPVRQFIRREAAWMERYVENGAYLELPTDIALPDDPPGSIREINQPAFAFVEQLARRQAIALLIDYGPLTSAPGTSVQAIRNNKYADPLTGPVGSADITAPVGSADITAHVDFQALAETARRAGAEVQGPVKQNAFLTALGLPQRTANLAQKSPEHAQNLRLAARRLTAPEAMGSLFKAMAICPKGSPPLPGFEA